MKRAVAHLSAQSPKKLSTKFSLVNILIFLLAAAMMAGFMAVNISSVTDEVSQDYAHLYSARVIGILNTHLDREIALMTHLARSPELLRWFDDENSATKRRAAFDQMKGTMELLQGGNLYFAIDDSYHEFFIEQDILYADFTHFAEITEGRTEDAWYFECIFSPYDYVLNVDTNKLDGRKFVWLNCKVERDGDIMGAMTTGLMLNQVLDELFSEYDARYVRSFVIDQDGLVQMDSAPEEINDQLIFESTYHILDVIDDATFTDTLEPHLAEVSGAQQTFQNPQVVRLGASYYRYASIAPIAGTTWSVVSFYNSSSLFSIGHLMPLFALIFGLLVAYMLVSVFISRRLLITPIGLFVESLTGKDPTKPGEDFTIYGLDRDDEFGSLARSTQDLISQLDNYNTQLMEKTVQAEAASKSKSTFLASMSHEIRTPINAIVGMTHIGKKTDDLSRKDDCFEKIDVASSHLLGVINDILDISKIEADKFELSIVCFGLEKLMQNLINVFTFRMTEKSIAFTVTLDSNLPQMVESDDQRLAQVITNLLSNAVKFTPEGGRIDLNIRLEDVRDELYIIHVSVKDSGIGIAEKDMNRLFNSFEQADNSTSRKFGGTGLGLTISKRIVELLGGTIGVDSTEGEGSTFYFSFAAKGRSLQQSLTVSKEKTRILAVDDDEFVRSFFYGLADHLPALGDEIASTELICDTAANLEDAMLFIQENTYDIFFLDYFLPDGRGTDLVPEIRTLQSPDVPIVIISGLARDDLDEASRRSNFFKVLSKPLLPSVIFDCIAESMQTQPAAGESVEDAENGCFAGKRILLTDDVDINREIFCAILEHTGVVIDQAENGFVAVEKFQTNPEAYDLIMMDLQMPVMDGFQATINIRSLDIPRAKTVPIIAMTANVFKEDVDTCIASGMNDHLGKPIDFPALMKKLHQYID